MQYTTINNENTINNNKKVYFKLPFIGNFSNTTEIKPKKIFDKYCKNTNVVVEFSSLRTENFFSCKDSIPKFLQSYVTNFLFLGFTACYIGENKRHMKTRIKEDLGEDKNLQILKHLLENSQFGQVSSFDHFYVDCFDRDNSHFRS